MLGGYLYFFKFVHMNMLQPYISNLLKENDCVIIPGFGAFIAREISASYDARKQVYLSPGKELSFNALLKEDDGLLVNHISRSKELSYAQAMHMVSERVKEANTLLAQGKLVHITEIGTFSTSDEGKIEFNPESLRYNHLSFYGVQHDLHIKELDYSKINLPIPVVTENKVKNSMIKWSAVGIAAAILIGLLVTWPFENGNMQQQQAMVGISYLMPSRDDSNVESEALAPNETIVENSTVSSTEVPEVETNQPEEIKDETVTNNEMTISSISGKRYHVVIGSLPTRGTALAISNEFKEKGITADVLDCGDRFRIVNKSFQNKEEALQYMEQLRNVDIALQEAWVYVQRMN